MGGGIAMSFANAGFPVALLEADAQALERGEGVIRSNYQASVARGKLTQEEMDARLALIRPTLSYGDLADADLIIEAVFEDIGVKHKVFDQLDAVARSGAILATNTSYLEVCKIAEFTRRPQDVVGMHFFSPAHVMKLLENVRAKKTAPDVLETVMDVGRKIGKVAVLVGDGYGFVGNRMLAQRTREAWFLLEEGATPHQVDDALTDFGFAMGPFGVSDLAGLDIGWRNRKARAHLRKAGIERRDITDEEIVQRCLYSMINEGARILSEKIADRPEDIDTIWLHGYGFPASRGGPMRYADDVGLRRVLATIVIFQEKFGPDFWIPAPLLSDLAAQGRGFYSAK